jgi:hypothetical protein
MSTKKTPIGVRTNSVIEEQSTFSSQFFGLNRNTQKEEVMNLLNTSNHFPMISETTGKISDRHVVKALERNDKFYETSRKYAGTMLTNYINPEENKIHDKKLRTVKLQASERVRSGLI